MPLSPTSTKYQLLIDVLGKPLSQDKQEANALQERLQSHYKNLRDHQDKKAKFGIDYPVHINREIEAEEAEIDHIKRRLVEIKSKDLVAEIVEICWQDSQSIVEGILSQLVIRQICEECEIDGLLKNWITDWLKTYLGNGFEDPLIWPAYQNKLVIICLRKIEELPYLCFEYDEAINKTKFRFFLDDSVLIYEAAVGLTSEKTIGGWFSQLHNFKMGRSVLEYVCLLAKSHFLVEDVINGLLNLGHIEAASRCFVSRNLKSSRDLGESFENNILNWVEWLLSQEHTWITDRDWILRKLCSDPSGDVRLRMMRNLLPLLDDKAIPYLLLGIEDPIDSVCNEATNTLFNLTSYETYQNDLTAVLPKAYIAQLSKDQIWDEVKMETRRNLLKVMQRLEPKHISSRLYELDALETAQIAFENLIQDLQIEMAALPSSELENASPNPIQIIKALLQEEKDILREFC